MLHLDVKQPKTWKAAVLDIVGIAGALAAFATLGALIVVARV